jgi:hypothetical protein
MQLEYDRCGLPQTQVIFDCHRDHIDILEELLIDQLKGPDMLNTTYPQVTRTDEVAILINKSRDLLHLSTFEHLELLHRVETRVTEMRAEKDAAETALEQMRDSGYIMDQDYLDALALCNKFKDRYFEHKRELQRLEKLSWWDRLFNYKVYV